VLFRCCVKGLHDVEPLHRGKDVAGHQHARVVIEVVEDLGASAVSKLPVGEVALPHLVGQVGFEADVGTLRLLLRLRSDQPVAFEDAPDRRHRGDVGMGEPEMMRDRVRSAVIAGGVELLAQHDDRGLDLGRRGVGAGPGAARTRFEGSVAALPVAGEQLGDPGFGNAGAPGHLAMASTVPDDRFDDVPLHAHGPPPLVGTMS
jgi:hypothetical protein